MSDKTNKERVAEYPFTDDFKIIDTIGVPHPYCIGSRHIGNASDNFNGMLGEAAIEDGERKGITCEIKGCQLTYKEHETALLCEVNKEMELTGNKPLEKYLKGIADKCEADGFVGFSFIRST